MAEMMGKSKPREREGTGPRENSYEMEEAKRLWFLTAKGGGVCVKEGHLQLNAELADLDPQRFR